MCVSLGQHHASSITYLDVLICLFRSKRTAVTEEVDEANGNASIDVQDELQANVSDASKGN